MALPRTHRLVMEEAVIDDADFFLKLLNSPNWIRYIGDRNIRSKDAALNYIQSLRDSYQNNGFGLYKMVLKEEKYPIGICGFLRRDYLKHPDIGFAILPEYEGQGYTFESAGAVLEYGFNTLKFKTILAITTDENIASKNLLKKIGLKETGRIRPSEDGEELLVFSKEKY